MRKLFVLLLAFLPACACPDAQMASADLATYNWFAPMMTAYITTDPNMDESAKRTHLRALDAWRERVEVAARAAGVR